MLILNLHLSSLHASMRSACTNHFHKTWRKSSTSLLAWTKGKVVLFGNSVMYKDVTALKGEAVYKRGVWVGKSFWSHSNVVLTPEGAVESRSIRRLTTQLKKKRTTCSCTRNTISTDAQSLDMDDTKSRRRLLHHLVKVTI